MAKRKLTTLREVKKQWATERARAARKARRERFAAVLEKDRFETVEDIYNLVQGLSKSAVYHTAYYYVTYEIRSMSPQEIVKRLEAKRRKP
jgi:hypothetical protein